MTSLLAPAATAKSARILSDAEFSAWAREEVAVLDSEEPRPTPGPDFIPTPSDLVEAAKLLNAYGDDFLGEDERAMEALTTPDWDYFAELAWEAERIAAGPLF